MQTPVASASLRFEARAMMDPKRASEIQGRGKVRLAAASRILAKKAARCGSPVWYIIIYTLQASTFLHKAAASRGAFRKTGKLGCEIDVPKGRWGGNVRIQGGEGG